MAWLPHPGYAEAVRQSWRLRAECTLQPRALYSKELDEFAQAAQPISNGGIANQRLRSSQSPLQGLLCGISDFHGARIRLPMGGLYQRMRALRAGLAPN